MKKKELIIFVVVILAIFILIAFLFLNNKNKKENDSVKQTQVQQTENVVAGEFEKIMEDGSKVNQSQELTKVKTVDELEISDIKLVEKGNLSHLLANVKNPTDKTLGDFAITITMLDKEGNEITTLAGYIDSVEPGKTVLLDSSVTADVANAYDFKITKQ